MKPSELNAIIENESLPLAEREHAIADKELLINAVGAKISQIRNSRKLTDFTEWRMTLYALPEDDREAAVNEKLGELGL